MDAVAVVAGEVAVLDRDDVDTDQILPKQYLKRMGREGFGEFLFESWSKEPGWSLPAYPILAAGRNFGCGSSREHAVWALHDYGFRAIVAPSFGDIFYFNCTKMGVLPVKLPAAQVAEVMSAGRASIDLRNLSITWTGGSASFEIDPRIQRNMLNGLDDIGATLEHLDEVLAFEAANTELLINTVELEQNL